MRKTLALLAALVLALLLGSTASLGADVPAKVKVKAPRAPCVALSFSPDGALVAAVFRSKGTFVFDSMTGKEVFEVETEPAFGGDVAFSPSGKELFVLTGRLKTSIEVWNVESREKVRTIDTSEVAGLHASMALAPDGRHAVVAGVEEISRSGGKGIIVVVALEPSGGSRELETKRPFAPRVAFTPDGKRLFVEGMATMSRGSPEAIGVHCYDPATWTIARQYGSLLLKGLSFTPDGSRFYGGVRGAVMGYDTSDGEPIAEWKAHGDHYPRTACSHDGALVASWVYNISGKRDPWLCVFDANTGRRLKRMKPDAKQAVTAAFSPTSRRLAIGGETSLKIYDLSELKTAE